MAIEINSVVPFDIQAPIPIDNLTATELVFVLPEINSPSLCVRLRSDQPWKLLNGVHEYPLNAMEEHETVIFPRRDRLFVLSSALSATLFIMVNTQLDRR